MLVHFIGKPRVPVRGYLFEVRCTLDVVGVRAVAVFIDDSVGKSYRRLMLWRKRGDVPEFLSRPRLQPQLDPVPLDFLVRPLRLRQLA